MFLSLTLSSFISHFFLGNKTTGVPPLRMITTDDLKRSGCADGSKPNLKVVSDMKRMMKYVEEAGRDEGVSEERMENWTTAKMTTLYYRIRPGRTSQKTVKTSVTFFTNRPSNMVAS